MEIEVCAEHVEVLSPSTAEYDTEDKRPFYQRLPSVREYVLVAQDRRRVEVWRRPGEDWVLAVYEAGSRAEVPSIGFTFAVDELYEMAGVNLR
jgi:Uma2 family endonuclease